MGFLRRRRREAADRETAEQTAARAWLEEVASRVPAHPPAPDAPDAHGKEEPPQTAALA